MTNEPQDPIRPPLHDYFHPTGKPVGKPVAPSPGWNQIRTALDELLESTACGADERRALASAIADAMQLIANERRDLLAERDSFERRDLLAERDFAGDPARVGVALDACLRALNGASS
jgi:hypothetical protein